MWDSKTFLYNLKEKYYTESMMGSIITLAIMAASALSLFINLILLNSLLAAFIVYYLLLGIGLPLIDLFFFKKMSIKKAGAYLKLTPVKKNQWLWGALAGGGMTLIMGGAFFLFHSFFLENNAILETVNRWGISRSNILLIYLVMLLFNGATEEFFWRGYIHRRLEKWKNRPLAVALPVLFFGGQHIFVISNLVTNTLTIGIFMAAITGAGLVWQILREKEGSLFPCILSHMIVTGGYLSIFYFYILR